MRSAISFVGRMLPALLLLVVGLSLWEAVIRIFEVPPWLLPAPSAIAHRFLMPSTIWYHTRITVFEAATGFLISAVCGTLLSAVIVQSKFLERALLPYIVVSNSIPIIAIIPLLTIWLGFGLLPKVLIAAIISFFPVVTNTTRGLKSADRRMLEFMRSINAGRLQIFVKIQLRSALPYIFAGFKIAASLSLVGAVVAEFYSSDTGLGYVVITAATQLRTDLLFVAIVILSLIGVSTFSFFGYLEAATHRGEPTDAP